MTDSPAYDFYQSYQFRAAIEAYKRQLVEGPYDEWVNTDGLAHALMGAGEFAEAIPYLEKMDEHSSNSHPGALGRQVELSICRWLIGERARALDIIKGLVVAVRDRKVYYTDFAGGTSYGVILCYMAATLRAPPDVKLALTYLKKLSTRRYIRNWPGPAAMFLLGQVTFEEAMKNGTGVADLPEAKKVAEHDVLIRRHLTSLLFAAAVERRLVGDERECRKYMTECASLANTLCEDEWYLARCETGTPE
jgi:tetratricopeptide (TPR) repeat protein